MIFKYSPTLVMLKIRKLLRFPIPKGMEFKSKGYGLLMYTFFGVTVTIMWFSYSNMALTMPLIKSNDSFIETPNKSGVFSSLFNLSLDDNVKFIVHNAKCQIPDLDVWDKQVEPLIKSESYISCGDSLLTYIKKDDDDIKVKINTKGKLYSRDKILCCASEINRKTEEQISLSTCHEFKDELSVNSSVFVKCYNRKNSKKVLYKNVHAVVHPKDVKNKIQDYKSLNSSARPLSVLIISVDSVSRLNSHRALPKTRKFLEENDWIELMGYNKVGENTFPNVMAMLAGLGEFEGFKTCDPTVSGNLDKCKMLWYDYRNLGYVTAYAEDQTGSSTFNYHKKGFEKPPTDYYLRSYMIAAEKQLKNVQKDGMTYCTGPETTGERVMNIIKDFTSTFPDNPYFGLFWMNSFSHNELNSVSRMDGRLKNFLTDLSKNNDLENTITIFMSDHGMRFGDIRYTRSGWYEDKLPFFFVRLSQKFKENFPKEYSFLRGNVNRLTTPFDLHQTLKHVLVLSGKNYTMNPANACPKCKSLFEAIPEDRSCQDAGIPRTWCTCHQAKEVDTEAPIVKLAGKYVVNIIENWKNNIGGEAKKCQKFEFDKVITALAFTNENYIYIGIKTSPEAIFEAPVIIKGNQTHPELEASFENVLRIDFYGKQKCVKKLAIKKMCACK